MGSQFVDLDADGRIDFVTATFDGSPHVAYGLAGGGFGEPQHLLDAAGKRVMLAQYWDYDANEWRGTSEPGGHCISAVAFDWDADGDFDLLLGDKDDGNLFLQRNEGEPGAPKFTGVSEPVLAGGKPFALNGGMTAPRLVDWDGDGLIDIVAGSFGSSWDAEPPGGVWLYRNVGKPGAPEFGTALALIPPTKTTGDHADRPNVGLYADPVDYDQDGDLDLVVGGYSIWMPKPPELTAAQRQRLGELKAELATVSAELQTLSKSAQEASAELGDEDRKAQLQAFYASAEYRERSEARSKLQAEHDELEPGRQRKAGVWVYLRESS